MYDLQRELGGCRKLLLQNSIEFESKVIIPEGIVEGVDPNPNIAKEYTIGS